MTLDSGMVSLAMNEILQGAALLLCALMCISTLYLALIHLARTIRTRMQKVGDADISKSG
jgi:hypothetical protein